MDWRNNMSDEKILIVDDNPFIRKTFRRHLEIAGYEVFDAEDGQSALDRLELHDIDVVLLDISMPRMSGVECLDRIKNKYKNIPAVMITAVTDVHTAVEAMKMGALDYITKPIKKGDLLIAVERAIKERDVVVPFEVNHAIILNRAGIVLYHKNLNPGVRVDEDIFGGMFTAIKMFVHESLRVDGGLKNIEQGDYNILIEEGQNFYLAIIGVGKDLTFIREKMKRTVKRINKHFDVIISNWRGDHTEFDGMDIEFRELIS